MERNKIILVRHGYDDHSYIDGKNDTSLIERGIDEAKQAAKNIYTKVNSDKVIIRHSVKLRAKQTAEIICDYLLKHNIDCTIISDHGLTELFQGKFNFGEMTHNERVDFLQSCWDDFESCRHQGDLTHRFGQNKDCSIITSLGENHLEWSVRIANGTLNIINDLENSYQSISITHRGAIFVIQNLIEMINDRLPINQVEQYKTIWMSYCTDYSFEIEDIDKSKKLIKEYINQRSQNENNH